MAAVSAWHGCGLCPRDREKIRTTVFSAGTSFTLARSKTSGSLDQRPDHLVRRALGMVPCAALALFLSSRTPGAMITVAPEQMPQTFADAYAGFIAWGGAWRRRRGGAARGSGEVCLMRKHRAATSQKNLSVLRRSASLPGALQAHGRLAATIGGSASSACCPMCFLHGAILKNLDRDTVFLFLST